MERRYVVPQMVFGLLHLAMTAPMIYLALGLPLLMRQHGWSGLDIGLFQLAGIPAAAKLLLAMPIECWSGSWKTTRHAGYFMWAMVIGLGYLGVLVMLVMVDLDSTKWLLFSLLAVCVLCATWADVPVSALSFHIFPDHERVRAGGVRSAAMFLAAIMGGGVMVVLSQRAGWGAPWVVMAVLLALALLVLHLMLGKGSWDYDVAPPAASGDPAISSHPVEALRGYFGQTCPWIWIMLLFGYFPCVGVVWIYLKPLLLDQGFMAEHVAWIVGVGGGTLGALGSIIVGQRVAHDRINDWLVASAWGNVVILALLSMAAWWRASPSWLVTLSLALAVAVGVASSLVFSLMMDFARPSLQAMDYGVQASIYNSGRLLMAPLAGWMFDHVGAPIMVGGLAVCACFMAFLASCFGRNEVIRVRPRNLTGPHRQY